MSELDPRLDGAFESLRRESAGPPRPEAMRAARAAMHQARATQPEATSWSMRLRRLRLVLTAPRLATGGGALAAGLAVVATLGWNAPVGSPLHAVRVAHEELALVLPGADRASLELGYAEARLHQVQADGWSRSALDEAAHLLDDARSHLSPGSSLWPRLESDEKLLGALRQREDGSEGGGDTGNGAPEGGSTGTTSTDHDGSSTSTSQGGGSTDEHQTTTTTTSTEQSSSGQDGGGSSSSTSTQSSGGGGGSDGGGGGGGGGGGSSGGGSDGSDGGGGSSSSSSTSGGG